MRLIIFENNKPREMTPDEAAAAEKQSRLDRVEANSRPLTAEEVNAMLIAQQINTLTVDDNTALRMTAFYPKWDDCVVKGTVEYDKPGFKFSYGDKLFRCINPNPTFQADRVPGIDTASLYTEICETHAGTMDDPIPAARNMEYTYGLIYLDPEDGKLYLCSRAGEAEGGTITLNYLPHELVGIYFEVI